MCLFGCEVFEELEQIENKTGVFNYTSIYII